MARVARAEAEAGLAGDHGLAQAERHGGDAVFRAHRRQRIEVVRSRDAGQAGIEPGAVPAADDPLEDDRHFFLFEAVGTVGEVAFRRRAEGGSVHPLDRRQQLPPPHVDARVIVGQHERVIDAGKRLKLRVLKQA